jgi:putative Mn2+ efflux pump MntP
MHITELILLSLSLAADAFAVAIWAGITEKKNTLKKALLMAISFGVFQAVMPIIGFMGASLFSEIIKNYDHWIAFVLLWYLGVNMIYSWIKWEEDIQEIKNIFSWKSIITLSFATSIDALAVWVSLTATEDNSILLTALSIWLITFLLSFIWVEFWKKFWNHIGKNAEIAWWIILIFIGTKILISHIFLT